MNRTESSSKDADAMVGVERKFYRNQGNRRVLASVPENARAVLDVGCGAGDNASILHQNGIVVDGITLSEDEASQAKAHCRSIWIHNLENGLPDALNAEYDAVLCSHVLEHICFPKKLLEDSKRVLKPGGELIIAIPNLLWWKTRLQLTMGRFEYDSSGIMDNTHFRWYTFRSAQRLLEEHGFQVVTARGYGAFPLGPIRRFTPRFFARWMDELSSRVLPGLIGYELVFTARVR